MRRKAPCWLGVARGQSVPAVAALPGGPAVFWRVPYVRPIRRVYAQRRKKLQKLGKTRALLKLESRERRIITPINHCISKEIVALAVRDSCGIRLEDLEGCRKAAQGHEVGRRAEPGLLAVLSTGAIHQL